MKSKFQSVLKIRKQELEKAERNLASAQIRQRQNENLLNLALQEAKNIKAPKSANSNELKAFLAMRNTSNETLKNAQEKVELSKKEVAHFTFLHKKANMEFEKIGVLFNEEQKLFAKEQKKAEANFLNEIAINRFMSGKTNEK